MEYRKLGDKFIIRLDKGEEVVETIKSFCQKEKITAGSIGAIGAVKNIELRYFDPETKKYYDKKFEGSYEAAPISGNVSTMNPVRSGTSNGVNQETYLHLHACLGDNSFNSVAGHLKSALVSATLEVIIDSAAGPMARKFSEEVGLNLLNFS